MTKKEQVIQDIRHAELFEKAGLNEKEWEVVK